MEALDGILHLDEGVAQLTGQGLGLPTLGVDWLESAKLAS